ncbi:unnamed protein product [Sympodiomycopsis kandeliae]
MSRRPRPKASAGLNRDEAIVLDSDDSASRSSSPQVVSATEFERRTASQRPLRRKIQSEGPLQVGPNADAEQSLGTTSSASRLPSISESTRRSMSHGIQSSQDVEEDDDSFFDRRRFRSRMPVPSLQPFKAGQSSSHSLSSDQSADELSSEEERARRRRPHKQSRWQLEQTREEEHDVDHKSDAESVGSSSKSVMSGSDNDERDELASIGSDADHGPHSKKRRGVRTGSKRPRSASLTPPPPISDFDNARLKAMLDVAFPEPPHEKSDGSESEQKNESVRQKALRSQRERRPTRGKDPSAANGQGPDDEVVNGHSKDTGAGDDSIDEIHPDLALYYRGEKAEQLRQKAKKLEEERRKREAERLARQKELDAEYNAKREAERRERQERNKRHLLASQRNQSADPERNTASHQKAGSDEDTDDIEFLEEISTQRKSSANAQSPKNDCDTTAVNVGPAEVEISPAAEDLEPRISLTLRAANGHVLEVKVKKTSLFRAMLDGFLASMTDFPADKKSKAKLLLDGEELDLNSTTEDEDLEGEEMIDVVW